MEQVYLNDLRRLRDQYDLNAELEQEIAELESVYEHEGDEWLRIKSNIAAEIEQTKREFKAIEIELRQFDQTVADLDRLKSLSANLTEAADQARILFNGATILGCGTGRHELVVPQEGKVAYISVSTNGNKFLLHFRESTCHHMLEGGCGVNGNARLRQKPAGDGWYQAPHFHVGSAADFVCWMRSKSEAQVQEDTSKGPILNNLGISGAFMRGVRENSSKGPIPIPGQDLWRWKIENYGTAINRNETRYQQLDWQLEYLEGNAANIISFCEMRYALNGRGFVFIEWPGLPFPKPEEIPDGIGYLTEKQLSFADLDAANIFVSAMREYDPINETVVLFCDAAGTFSNILRINRGDNGIVTPVNETWH